MGAPRSQGITQRIIPGVRKIAVLRANALGDLMLTLPAFDALKAAYPDAELVLLAHPWHHDFLVGHPGPVDRVAVIPVSEGLRVEPGRRESPEELDRFFAAMQREGFDLAVQLHGGGRYSNGFVRRLGARLTVGRRTPDAPPLDMSLPFFHYQHEVARHLETVGLAGAPPLSFEPYLEVTDSDFLGLREHFDTESAYVVLHSMATDPRRCWSASKFATIADWLAGQGYRVVLTGQEPERPTLDEISSRMAHPCTVLCDALTQRNLAALLAMAQLVIANDTGPAHLARAVRTPTITIFWGPNLVTAGPVNRARDRVAISWRMTCPVCGVNYGHSYPYRGETCDHQASLVDEVPVEEVIEAARELLHGAVGADGMDLVPPRAGSADRTEGRRPAS